MTWTFGEFLQPKSPLFVHYYTTNKIAKTISLSIKQITGLPKAQDPLYHKEGSIWKLCHSKPLKFDRLPQFCLWYPQTEWIPRTLRLPFKHRDWLTHCNESMCHRITIDLHTCSTASSTEIYGSLHRGSTHSSLVINIFRCVVQCRFHNRIMVGKKRVDIVCWCSIKISVVWSARQSTDIQQPSNNWGGTFDICDSAEGHQNCLLTEYCWL